MYLSGSGEEEEGANLPQMEIPIGQDRLVMVHGGVQHGNLLMARLQVLAVAKVTAERGQATSEGQVEMLSIPQNSLIRSRKNKIIPCALLQLRIDRVETHQGEGTVVKAMKISSLLQASQLLQMATIIWK